MCAAAPAGSPLSESSPPPPPRSRLGCLRISACQRFLTALSVLRHRQAAGRRAGRAGGWSERGGRAEWRGMHGIGQLTTQQQPSSIAAQASYKLHTHGRTAGHTTLGTNPPAHPPPPPLPATSQLASKLARRTCHRKSCLSLSTGCPGGGGRQSGWRPPLSSRSRSWLPC